MSTIPDPHLFRGHRPPHSGQLRCSRCRTGQHLVIHSVESMAPPRLGMVTVTYACEGCGNLRSQHATVPQIAAILNQPGPSPAAEVLQFGGHYIHCGQPMRPADTNLRSMYFPATTDAAAEGDLAVYLSTRVLRCDCGFQMDIPR